MRVLCHSCFPAHPSQAFFRIHKPSMSQRSMLWQQPRPAPPHPAPHPSPAAVRVHVSGPGLHLVCAGDQGQDAGADLGGARGRGECVLYLLCLLCAAFLAQGVCNVPRKPGKFTATAPKRAQNSGRCRNQGNALLTCSTWG